MNIEPKWGLYNGAIGTVVDIIFRKGEPPNEGHLPTLVVVDLTHYRDQCGKRTIVHMYQLCIFRGDVNPCVVQEIRSHYRYHGQKQFIHSMA
jgi:hypothetical protein